jgi:hypothetical protein
MIPNRDEAIFVLHIIALGYPRLAPFQLLELQTCRVEIHGLVLYMPYACTCAIFLLIIADIWPFLKIYL